jgi:iron(III) transport system substrate-binding protein
MRMDISARNLFGKRRRLAIILPRAAHCRRREEVLSMYIRNIVISAAVVLTSASLALAQDAAEWAKVTAAAKAEGKVVFYSGLVGSPSTAAIARAFEKKYGIAAEFLDLRISEIRERMRAEQIAGRVIGDVLTTSYNVTTSIENNEGYIQPLKPFPAKSRVREGSKIDNPTGTQAPVYMLKYGILVNTRLVPPADEPKSWTDLTNPKWTGKILADDPRALGGGFNAFVAQHDKLGVDFLKKLADQKLTFSRDFRESEKRTARGEFPVYAPFLFNDYSSLRGLPIKAIVPVEGVAYVQFVASMIKNAPHPNAALLFIDFLLSDEAQVILATEGLGAAIDGIDAKIPEDLRPLVTAKEMGTADWRREKELLALAKDIFK